MIWPPVKAWTSKEYIYDQVHFVAINYGGKLLNRWVILMSVIDSSVVLKVYISQLVDSSIWECGWEEINYSNSPKVLKKKINIKTTNSNHLSPDSGLTIPITKNTIRPWFDNS